MYEIIFSKKAEQQFKKLERNMQGRIVAVLERIRIRPESYISKLVGEPGYKVRIGDYRAILDIDQNKSLLLILKVGHRRNIYG